MKRTLMLVALAMTLIAAPAMAKEGLFIGAYLMPTEDTSGDALSGLDSGSGYGFKAGLGFNKYFSIDGIMEKSSFDVKGGGSAKMDGLAIDLHVNFPLTTLDSAKIMSFEPYLLFGYALKYEAKANGQTRSGSGPRYGFGIEQYLFRELSANVGWTRTSISFDKPNQDGTIRAFDIGLTYHFL
jgi:hypothetical protein